MALAPRRAAERMIELRMVREVVVDLEMGHSKVGWSVVEVSPS